MHHGTRQFLGVEEREVMTSACHMARQTVLLRNCVPESLLHCCQDGKAQEHPILTMRPATAFCSRLAAIIPGSDSQSTHAHHRRHNLYDNSFHFSRASVLYSIDTRACSQRSILYHLRPPLCAYRHFHAQRTSEGLYEAPSSSLACV